MLDADEEIAKCRRAFGEAPRRFSLWSRLTSLRVGQPGWARTDPLATFFSARARLLASGRVTWGHTVQANGLLFEPGRDNCPGEVVYVVDPAARLPVEELADIAHKLYELKGTQQPDPTFGEISHYLANEYVRVFGLRVPVLISPKVECAISTVFFARKHLPNRILSKGLYPILVSDTPPHVAMVLPSRFWSEELRRDWRSDDP